MTNNNRIIIAMLPTFLCGLCLVLPSHAASHDTDVKVTVEGSSIELKIEAPNISLLPGQVATGILKTTTTSGSGYNLSLKATNPALAGTNSQIPAGSNISAGNSAWGIKCASSSPTVCDKTAYTGVTTGDEVFAHNDSGATALGFDFTVGVSASSAQASGSYQTELTVTATAK